jgi:hypothetical protein
MTGEAATEKAGHFSECGTSRVLSDGPHIPPPSTTFVCQNWGRNIIYASAWKAASHIATTNIAALNHGMIFCRVDRTGYIGQAKWCRGISCLQIWHVEPGGPCDRGTTNCRAQLRPRLNSAAKNPRIIIDFFLNIWLSLPFLPS